MAIRQRLSLAFSAQIAWALLMARAEITIDGRVLTHRRCIGRRQGSLFHGHVRHPIALPRQQLKMLASAVYHVNVRRNHARSASMPLLRKYLVDPFGAANSAMADDY